MIFSSLKQQIREHVNDIKRVMMAVGLALVLIALLSAGIAPLFALWYRPQHPYMQWSLDQQHRWLNYGDTIPNMETLKGIQSKDPIRDGLGWTNRLSPTSVYNPLFIIDYNKCLSRALYTNKRYAGFHTRISLCPYPPYNNRIDVNFTRDPTETITIDIRKFGSNERGDMKATDRGIALTWDEYVTLAKVFKWVEFYYIRNREFDLVNPAQNETQTESSLGSNVQSGIDQLYIRPEVQNGTTTTTQRSIGDIY
jgi:hypothetical protein